MKLYEINSEIMRLYNSIEVDEETGELLGDAEDLLNQIYALEMEKHSILEWLAKLILNIRSEAAALKAEETRLKKRRERLEKKDDRLMKIIDRECAGEKTDLGIATVSYRKSNPLEVTDMKAAIKWLTDNGHMECLKFSEPEVRKTETKALIKKGTEVPGAAIVTKNNCSLK